MTKGDETQVAYYVGILVRFFFQRECDPFNLADDLVAGCVFRSTGGDRAYVEQII